MRQLKREVKIGNVTIGGKNPIAVQTMLNVPVEDIEGNVAQAKRCEAAGCQILRVTCPSAADAKCIEAVKNAVKIPIVADIHFDYKLALEAIAAGADEIDVVIPVGEVLERNYEQVYKELVAIREACAGVVLKVILETGELKTIESIFNASLLGAYAGADFIKTSTGKVPMNATPEAVYVICEALRQFHVQTGKMVGIKVAGGITKVQNAIRYLTIVKHVLGEAWISPKYFRIGTSQLLEDVLKEIKTVAAKDASL